MKTCPICGAQNTALITSELRRGEGSVYHCNECGHGFLENKIQDLKGFYKNDYRDSYSHNAEEAKTNAQELFDVYFSYQASRLKVIEPFLSENTSILEVGASSGQFLKHIDSKVGVVNAIELDEGCYDFLINEQKIAADCNYLEESKFSENLYDVVCAFQVMEHVESPRAFLQSLKKVCNKGGKIFVEVPNLNDPLISLWDIDEYKKFFYHDAHLHYFNESSLLKVLSEIGFGESSLKFHYTQDYNLLNHLNWIMNHAPQKDCFWGLNRITLPGNGKGGLDQWLSSELELLNEKYCSKLAEHKLTSNILIEINNE